MKQIQDGAECFCEAKHADTFNAGNQASGLSAERICGRIELAEAGVAKQLISAKRNSDSEEIEQP